MSGRRVIAIIPAAGRGRRMGQLKQLLTLGNSTMMETVIATAVASSVDGVVVVVNDAVRPTAERHASERCRIAVNPDPDSDMLRSIQIGWKMAVAAFGLSGDDGLLIMPADQPGIGVAAIDDVAGAYRSDAPSLRAVIATYAGRRGHPAVYPAPWIAETEQWPPGLGLNEVAKRHAADVVLKPQAGSLPLDVNTPAEFARASEIQTPK